MIDITRFIADIPDVIINALRRSGRRTNGVAPAGRRLILSIGDRRRSIHMALADNRIDDLDRRIILELQEDARRPYKEIASKLGVSESTISNRVNRLIRTGILKLEARVDPFKLANKVAAIIGIKLERRGHVQAVEEIAKIPGVSAVYVATGKYDLFIEVMEASIADLNDFLFHKSRLSKMKTIIATETFILLSSTTKFFKLG